MIEWNERGKHGWDYRTHPLGKHLESWVAADTWESLSRVFAHFNAEESWEALFATCELFGRVARETAQSLGCTYPSEIEERLVTFARHLRKEAAQPGAGADALNRAAQLSRVCQVLAEPKARRRARASSRGDVWRKPNPNVRGDEQEPDRRCGTPGTSGHVTTKSSIRALGVLYKSGVYARTALCLTLGDLPVVQVKGD
jgi:hypothetical protein